MSRRHRRRRARRNHGAEMGLFNFKPTWQKFVLGAVLIYFVSKSRTPAVEPPRAIDRPGIP